MLEPTTGDEIMPDIRGSFSRRTDEQVDGWTVIYLADTDTDWRFERTLGDHSAITSAVSSP
jgi:hypothetical protein